MSLNDYGLSTKQLEILVYQTNVTQIRSILARTPRRNGDEDVRNIWEAACLALEQRDEQCMTLLGTVKSLDLAGPYALSRFTRVYMRTENIAKAIQMANLEIKRNYPGGYEHRAACYSVEHLHKEAANDYIRAAELLPDRANGFYSKAAGAMLQAQAPAEALALVNKAPLGLQGMSDVSVYLTKALCLERLNRWSDAVGSLTKAVTICQSCISEKEESIKYQLMHCLDERAKCYEKLGKKAEAASDRRTQENLASGEYNDLFGKRH
jgi:tetratricopeptide (TPR) repeat protein